MNWFTWQIIPPLPEGPIPWVLGSVIAVTGIASAVLGLEALLNPILQESGVVTLNTVFTSEPGLSVLLIHFTGSSSEEKSNRCYTSSNPRST
jgi:hypothetical protein